MKTKLQILIAALSILFSMATASAQAPAINPTTGLPMPTQPDINPETELPADGSLPFKNNDGSPSWIDPNWTDSTNYLRELRYEGLPLTEVARDLREQFHGWFDIIIPASYQPPGQAQPLVPGNYSANLQLKDVSAEEIFRAMNLQFETENTPARWELMMNNTRPTVVLRFVPQLIALPPPQTRKVFFVGDMLDEFPGTNDETKLNGIANMIAHAGDVTGIQHGKVDIFPSGQLLIVSGTPDQVDLAEQTLRALKDKAVFEKTYMLVQPTNSY